MAVRLSASELPKLLLWLEQHLPDTIKLQGDLKSHLRGKFPDLDFFVDRWPSPLAATAVVDPNGQQCRPYYRNKILGVFGTKDEALRSLLTHCPYLDWTQPVEIEEGVAASVEPILKSLNKDELQAWPYVLLKATPSDMKPVPVPDGMKISSVTDATVDIVNSTWRNRGPYSSAYIRHLARHYPSVVMTTACGQHVGHVLRHSFGAMGMLYVMPLFRGVGNGKAIIAEMTQKYFSVGEEAYSFVHVDNSPSMNLCLSLGFKPVGRSFASYLGKLSIHAK